MICPKERVRVQLLLPPNIKPPSNLFFSNADLSPLLHTEIGGIPIVLRRESKFPKTTLKGPRWSGSRVTCRHTFQAARDAVTESGKGSWPIRPVILVVHLCSVSCSSANQEAMQCREEDQRNQMDLGSNTGSTNSWCDFWQRTYPPCKNQYNTLAHLRGVLFVKGDNVHSPQWLACSNHSIGIFIATGLLASFLNLW